MAILLPALSALCSYVSKAARYALDFNLRWNFKFATLTMQVIA